MVSSVLSMFSSVITFCFGIITGLLQGSGFMPVFLGVFAVFCIVRFIIIPLTGGLNLGGGKGSSNKGGKEN